MAYLKFICALLEGTPINMYKHGEMWRDLTYVSDLVRGIRGLIDAIPGRPETAVEGDSLSSAVPIRIVNIGNSAKVRLLDFIGMIEVETGCEAIRYTMPMPTGDVPATWTDATHLQRLTAYRPRTSFREDVARFMQWYRGYYDTGDDNGRHIDD